MVVKKSKTPELKAGAASLSIGSVLHEAGNYPEPTSPDRPYETVPHYDILTHFSFGMGIGSVLKYLASYASKSGYIEPENVDRYAIAGTLALGILWECIEHYYASTGIWPQIHEDFFNVVKDLCADGAGAYISTKIGNLRKILKIGKLTTAIKK